MENRKLHKPQKHTIQQINLKKENYNYYIQFMAQNIRNSVRSEQRLKRKKNGKNRDEVLPISNQQLAIFTNLYYYFLGIINLSTFLKQITITRTLQHTHIHTCILYMIVIVINYVSSESVLKNGIKRLKGIPRK